MRTAACYAIGVLVGLILWKGVGIESAILNGSAAFLATFVALRATSVE